MIIGYTFFAVNKKFDIDVIAIRIKNPENPMCKMRHSKKEKEQDPVSYKTVFKRVLLR